MSSCRPGRPDAPPERDLSHPGALEAIATEAGLAPETTFDTTWAYEFADEHALSRALVAPAGLPILVGAEREAAVKRAIVDGLAPYRTAQGGYRLENQFHFLIARA